MKRIIAFITALCLTAIAMPTEHNHVDMGTVKAVEEEGRCHYDYEDGVDYHIYSDHATASSRLLSGCEENPNLPNNNITLKSSVEGKPVTEIESNFYTVFSLESIEMPNSIIKIGENAFWGSRKLKSVTLSNSLLTIPKSCFYECTALPSIDIPSSVKIIDAYAFNSCSGLSSIDIPSSVVSIEDCAFMNCTNISSVTLPDSLKRLGNNAFSNCQSLKSITIPESVTNIDGYTFYDAGIEEITLPKTMERIPCAFLGSCKSLKSYDIPEHIKSIGEYAFYDCSGLRSVKIPDSVISIEQYAFRRCKALPEIEFPDSVKYIGDFAFDGCSSLRKLKLPNSISKINKYSFSECSDLSEVIIPDSVKSIEEGAFSKCDNLKEITLPASVKSIGDRAFFNCKNLDSITILNPDCVLDTNTTICNDMPEYNVTEFKGTIYGYIGSTAEEYAKKWGYNFKRIDEDKDPIIIVPGIMGSRLFNDKDCTDKVWSPNSDKLGIVLAFLTRITNPYPITYPSPEHDLFDLAERININNYLYVRNYDKNGRPINQNKLSKDEREYGAIDHLKITDDDNNNEEEYNNYASLGILDRLCERFPDREIYVFSYDWRRSNDESAQKLRDFVDALDTDKVDIVAHSMGGLVSSRYYAAYGGDKKIDKIITCGTPYEGAPHMFEAVELGMFTGEKANDAAMKYLGDLARNTIAEFDGVFELLPSMNYCDLISMSELKQIPNDEVDGIPDDEEDKSDIQIIESRLRGDSYRNMINKEYGVKAASKAFQFQNSVRGDNGYNVLLGYENAYFFIGQNRKTVRNVCFGRNNDDSVSSVPYYIDRVIYTENGDGTVPYFSASMCDQLRDVDTQHQFYVDSKHMDLMKNIHVISNVCRILDNEVTEYLPPINTDPYSVMRIDCPVDVEIGSGNDRLCSSPDSLSLESSFGRLDILGEDNDRKMLCIDENTGLDIDLTGTDTGTMDFTIQHYSGEDELLDERIFEDVPLTDKTIIKTKADNNEITVLSVDHDGDGVVDETWTAKKDETVKAPDEKINITTTAPVSVTTTVASASSAVAASTTSSTAKPPSKSTSTTTTSIGTKLSTSSTATTKTIVSSEYKLGDVTGDNIIDGRDATDVLTYYAKTSTGQTSKYTEEQKKAADVNNDGIIDGRDATAILTYYAKTSTGYTGTLTDFIKSIKIER